MLNSSSTHCPTGGSPPPMDWQELVCNAPLLRRVLLDHPDKDVRYVAVRADENACAAVANALGIVESEPGVSMRAALSRCISFLRANGHEESAAAVEDAFGMVQ